jgi:hypothetical protein
MSMRGCAYAGCPSALKREQRNVLLHG